VRKEGTIFLDLDGVLAASVSGFRGCQRSLETNLEAPINRIQRAIVFALAFTSFGAVATASETNSPKILPDAPSAVLATRSTSFSKGVSKTLPPISDAPSPDPPVSEQNTRPSLPRRALRDQKAIYGAPFQRRNLKWDLVFLTATGGLIAGDRHISSALSRDQVDVSQHVSDIGMYSMIASVGGLWLSSLKTKDEHANETGILAAEAFGNTAAVVGLTQMIGGRERPAEGNGNGRFWQNNAFGSSFPSAHSSFTWTMASVVAHEYPKPWVRWLVYGTATTVSVTRVTGLKHFSSDVAVGGAFGFLIGQQVFNAHSVRSLSFHLPFVRSRSERPGIVGSLRASDLATNLEMHVCGVRPRNVQKRQIFVAYSLFVPICRGSWNGRSTVMGL